MAAAAEEEEEEVCPTCRVDLPPGPEQLYEDAVLRWMVLGRPYFTGNDKPFRELSRADRVAMDGLLDEIEGFAERGVPPKARIFMAELYTYGQGRAVDPTKAAGWWRRSADAGNVGALTNLGIMYKYGQGVPQDYSRALACYREAADRGDAKAALNLANMYSTGTGCDSRNEKEAHYWYLKAAKQGNATAQYNCALQMAAGHGCPVDGTASEAFMRASAAQGNEHAARVIAIAAEEMMSAEERAAAAAFPFPLGSHVLLSGLKARPELNGEVGIVMAFQKASKRWSVQIIATTAGWLNGVYNSGGQGSGEAAGATFNLKPENLQLLKRKVDGQSFNVDV